MVSLKLLLFGIYVTNCVVICTYVHSCLCRYLQWLIEDQGSEEMHLHTLYALSLARSAIELVERDSKLDNHLAERSNEMSASDVANKGALSYHVREKLQLFLQASDLYDPEVVLKVVEGSELWLEKVSDLLFLFYYL